MPSIDDLLKKQKGKAQKLGIETKKIKRDGPSRPWEIRASDFKAPEVPENPQIIESKYIPTKVTVEEKVSQPVQPKAPSVQLKASEPAKEMARHFPQSGTPSVGSVPNLERQNEMPMARQNRAETKNNISTKHLMLLAYFKKLCGSSNQAGPTNYFQLANETGLPERSLKRYVKELKEMGVIEQANSGWQPEGSQGTIFIFNQRLLNDSLSLSFLTSQNAVPMGGHFRRSSSNNINFIKTTTTESMNGMPNFLEELDLSKLPGVDRQKLRKYFGKYPDRESMQDFIDRVAFAIESQKGTKSAINHPGAFIDSCYDKGFVDVPSTYKSRRVLAEEEALKREQAELEEIQKAREKRRLVEGEKAKIKFTDWLDAHAMKRMAEFEQKVAEKFPVTPGYPVPPSIKAGQLKQVQVEAFLIESDTSPSLRDILIS